MTEVTEHSCMQNTINVYKLSRVELIFYMKQMKTSYKTS